MPSQPDPSKSALRVALIFMVAATAWIYFSDRILRALGVVDEILTPAQTVNGLVFVLIIGILVFFMVRRSLRRAQESARRLRRSEERISGLLERLNEAVYRMSLPDGRYEYLSPAMEKVFGYSAEEFRSQAILIKDILHPDYADYFVEMWQRLITGDVPPTYEYEIIDPEGRKRSISQSNTGIFDDSGAIVAIEGSCRDVTERRRLEERIRQSQKLESLGLLAGGIAHDFNNLLLSVLGNADLALHELPPGSRAADSLLDIRRAALRASDLSNQMLAYSGRGRFVVTALDLNELIGELGDMLQVNLPAGVEVERRLLADLPAVRADGTQIRQVVMNLITNAGEACADGGGRIRVSTGVVEVQEGVPEAAVTEGRLEPGLCVVVEIADDGCGMESHTLARLFDPFYSTKPAGRGLGLAAALGIVRGHEGAIQVDSRPGEGSVFRLLLPAVPERVKTPAAPRERPADRSGGTILIVDDEQTVLDTAERMLENRGYAVFTASGGARALEIYEARGEEIDAVLLDLTMPEMSGEAVFRALRRLDADVPVILTSGWTAEDSAAGFEALGMAGFLQKPYTLRDLAEAVERALGPVGESG